MNSLQEVESIDTEVERASRLEPYVGVSELWVCLVKYANTRPTVGEEPEQVASLVRGLAREAARDISSLAPFKTLCELDPPLESVLAHERERLQSLQVTKELGRLRRASEDPKAAVVTLVSVLNRVRDKKMHGFKTPEGPRDSVILLASSELLYALCKACSSLLNAGSRPIERDRPGA